MSSKQHFNAVVIGSGQGGTPLAGAFAKAGKSVALIESTHIGGTCINEGCTPTKTMVASGRVAYLARRSQDYGVNLPSAPTIDMKKIRQRKRDIVDSFRGGSERRVQSSGIELITGTAKFVDPHTVTISPSSPAEPEKTISADQFFINVGARPTPLVLRGLESVDRTRVLDSTSILELDVVPSHLIVLGGGPIGLEFAQLFRRLGAAVTIIQRGAQLIPREDPDIAESMTEILEEDGITILLSTKATSISTSESSPIVLSVLSSDGNSHELQGSHLLAAAGRVPNTDILAPKQRTNVPHIYALGDVKGGPAFTHVSYDDFRILAANLIDPGPGRAGREGMKRTTKDRLDCYVTYTDPQLGHVGLHEAEARKIHGDENVAVAKMPMAYVARALECGESRGVMKAVVEKGGEGRGRILGFTCLGLEGGEVMAVVQMAMMGGVTWEGVQGAVFAHPSLSEGLNNLWGFLE
ncbi:uncharacterized protein KY384_006707 [Bacidia gigantensis]|uniref:uncharacterized protein n=1 Tax=Bacidia gigantensis TaxID=2732470 RepID=UPI001D04DB1D|nr:uncharacterized protein KY384_006707 [Bacidia gigantensis]KAG8529017.1 hypothetical protein KY384_006707 [Bacidia gigantensis]